MLIISSILGILRRNRPKIVKSFFILIFSIGLYNLTYGQPPGLGTSLVKDFALAILIAMTVRTVDVLLSEEWQTLSNSDLLKAIKSEIASTHSSLEKTSHTDLLEAIKNAESRVWISSTWIPGTEYISKKIVNTKAKDIRILLASFKEGSMIFSRIQGRKFNIESAKKELCTSVKPFIEKCKSDCVRFNYGHHPAWIAVVDSAVYWGPTPVDVGNWDKDFLFHKHLAATEAGEWWIAQFELLWTNFSHDYSEEKQKYNDQLL